MLAQVAAPARPMAVQAFIMDWISQDSQMWEDSPLFSLINIEDLWEIENGHMHSLVTNLHFIFAFTAW